MTSTELTGFVLRLPPDINSIPHYIIAGLQDCRTADASLSTAVAFCVRLIVVIRS